MKTLNFIESVFHGLRTLSFNLSVSPHFHTLVNWLGRGKRSRSQDQSCLDVAPVALECFPPGSCWAFSLQAVSWTTEVLSLAVLLMMINPSLEAVHLWFLLQILGIWGLLSAEIPMLAIGQDPRLPRVLVLHVALTSSMEIWIFYLPSAGATASHPRIRLLLSSHLASSFSNSLSLVKLFSLEWKSVHSVPENVGDTYQWRTLNSLSLAWDEGNTPNPAPQGQSIAGKPKNSL